ncbi:MAG: hypothetical protein ACK4UQ_06760 [Brevundimonas sp.]
MDWSEQKILSDEGWGEIRRGWEAGETGASLARRYQVGLANLWRRRASEGWARPERPDPRPEPVEGWDRWGRARLEAFERQLAEARALALTLAAGMQGEGPPEGVPLWHVGFVLDWRAGHLGPEVAARDRDWLTQTHPWTAEFWDAAGRLSPVDYLDMCAVMANRDAWREEVGLPPGVAVDVP